MDTPLRDVSDTALWVAMYRAMESGRPDALFRDPYARRLAGERGEAIVRAMPRGRSMAWPMIVRTAVMDEIVMRLVGEGVRTVVNLAAGLDTRAYRLALPPDLKWLDVDLPAMIEYRREHLSGAVPVCAHRDVAVDLREAGERTRFLRGANEAGRPALVITEGLLVYLTRDQVGALARDAHDIPGVRWWLIDLASPALLRLLRRTWQPSLESAGTPMQFAPEEGTEFFGPAGWREAEFRSTWDEARRLRRMMPMAWLWILLSRLQPEARREAGRRMSGVVLLDGL